MTPDDDLKDAGEHIKVLGIWSHLNGAGGTCICECVLIPRILTVGCLIGHPYVKLVLSPL